MPTQIECPTCRKKATVPDSTAGKNVKCSCGVVFQVPEAIALEELALQSTPAVADQLSALKCSCCGAALPVATNVESFQCSICKTTFTVKRQAGVVSLIADAIQKIQVGTDKTAAELALPRIRK